jgi:hypothetical protein
MKHTLSYFLFLSCLLSLKAQTGKQFNASFGFMENKGQITDQNGQPRPDVLYNFIGQGLTVQIQKTGFSYSLLTKSETCLSSQENARRSKEIISIDRIDIGLVNANPDADIIAEDPSQAVFNFLTKNVTAPSITDVHQYQKLTFKKIYPFIDLVFYLNGTSLKYDFIIHPGGDPSSIHLQYNGADQIKLAHDSLLLNTPHGIITERIPLCFLKNETKKTTVPCSYMLNGNTVSFNINSPSLDKQSSLVIDPTISRIWGTYYGRQGFDWFEDVVTDNNSNIIACGASGYGSTTLATAGAYQYTSAGQSDGLLVKFDSAGARVWSTYYGGTGDDYFMSITADASGHLILAGYTESTSGITTANAWQPNFGGGTLDGFIARFSSNGFPEWSTYIGGAQQEYLLCVKSDSHDNIYVGGYTSSTSNIATPNAFQTTYAGGTYDGIVVRLDSSGSVYWSTYFGGSGSDEIHGINIVSDSLLYFDGKTNSATGIATAGSYQSIYAGNSDGMIAKFDSSGIRNWVTYYGGPAADGLEGISHNSSGQIIITGSSTSTSAIASPGAFQTTSSGSEAMIIVLNSDGTRYWATYYGGADTEAGYDVAIDNQNNIIASGRTMSPTGIATPGAWQTVHASYTQVGSDKLDAFVVKFTPAGLRIWGTYYGGDHGEEGDAVAIDNQDRIVLCGETGSTTNMSSANAFQPNFYDSWEGYITRFDQLVITTDSIGSPFCAGSSVNVSFNAQGNFGPTNTFIAQLSNASGSFTNPINIGSIVGVTSGIISATIPTTTSSGSGYRIRVYSFDRGVADGDNGNNLTIWPLPVVSIAIFPAICIDAPIIPLPQIVPGGQPAGGTFSGPGVDASGNFDPLAAGPGIHTISYTYTDIHNCATQTASQLVNVSTHTTVTFNSIPSVCSNAAPFILTQGQPSGGIYFGTGITSTNQFDPSVSGPGTFTITYLYTSNSVCLDSASQTITVYSAPPVPVITNTNNLLSTTGTGSFQWFFNSGAIAGATSSTYLAQVNGNYQVSITDMNGCTSMSAVLPVVITTIQTLSLSNVQLFVFPNPFSDQLQLQFDVNTTSVLSVSLFDITGREYQSLLLNKVYEPGTYIESSDTFESLSSGLYLLKIGINGQVGWLRVIKK